MHRLRTVVPQSVLLSLSSRQTPKIFLLFTRTFYKTKKRLTLKRYWVDQEGLEPSSKQGNNMLSTRLSQTSFSSIGKTCATNRCLIL